LGKRTTELIPGEYIVSETRKVIENNERGPSYNKWLTMGRKISSKMPKEVEVIYQEMVSKDQVKYVEAMEAEFGSEWIDHQHTDRARKIAIESANN
jgi:hypothetical protein